MSARNLQVALQDMNDNEHTSAGAADKHPGKITEYLCSFLIL